MGVSSYRVSDFISLWRELRRHHKWDRTQLELYQARALGVLREYAYANSPFYRRFHSKLTNSPLEELPVLTKAELMRNWDELVTDRTVRLAEVKSFLANLNMSQAAELFDNRYYAVSTAGSTGLRGIFIYEPREWLTVMASYLRVIDWAGIKLSQAMKAKTALVSTTSPWHQSALLGATSSSLFLPIVSIDSVEPMVSIVAELNAYQPRFLVAYANMARLLAQERIAGSLKISPEAVFCVSEVLTDDSRKLIRRAWKIEPFSVYSATETAGIASECEEHKGLHLYEDLVIIESVDRNNKPVSPGEYGAKVLATVLFSRTIPLIRYEISDSVCLSTEPCTCHCPFASIANIQGRTEDVLHFTGRLGETIFVQPNVFHDIMDEAPAGGWQIIQEQDNRLKVLIRNPEAGFDENSVVQELSNALEKLGVSEPAIRIERVASIGQGALGKTHLIISAERATQP